MKVEVLRGDCCSGLVSNEDHTSHHALHKYVGRIGEIVTTINEAYETSRPTDYEPEYALVDFGEVKLWIPFEEYNFATDKWYKFLKRLPLQLWVFIDCSGSMPQIDPDLSKIFVGNKKAQAEKVWHQLDVKTFLFDTNIVEFGQGRPNYGGTNFENVCKFVNDAKEKPDHVFVITDGYGTPCKVEEPDKWTWFLLNEDKETENFLKRILSGDCAIKHINYLASVVSEIRK